MMGGTPGEGKPFAFLKKAKGFPSPGPLPFENEKHLPGACAGLWFFWGRERTFAGFPWWKPRKMWAWREVEPC